MADALVRAEIFNSSMLANVNVIHTEDGRPISRPSIADQATLGAIPGENTGIGASVDCTTTSNTVLNAFQYAALVKASWQMDQDVRPGDNGGFDLSDALADVIGARIGSVLQRDLTVGVGTTAPSGLFDPTVGAAVGFTMATGSTTTFATGVLGFTAMRTLRDSVNAVYWPTAAWMCNTATASLIEGLLDASGRPFFDPSKPCTPLGFPILINDSVPALSANALVMSFGSLSRGYTARLTPQSVTVLRERFADLAQTGYVGHVKCDGKVSGDLGAVKLLKMAAS
jgi:HK97 family phage major capsid protein